jgi:hypothetical protein
MQQDEPQCAPPSGHRRKARPRRRGPGVVVVPNRHRKGGVDKGWPARDVDHLGGVNVVGRHRLTPVPRGLVENVHGFPEALGT